MKIEPNLIWLWYLNWKTQNTRVQSTTRRRGNIINACPTVCSGLVTSYQPTTGHVGQGPWRPISDVTSTRVHDCSTGRTTGWPLSTTQGITILRNLKKKSHVVRFEPTAQQVKSSPGSQSLRLSTSHQITTTCSNSWQEGEFEGLRPLIEALPISEARKKSHMVRLEPCAYK